MSLNAANVAFYLDISEPQKHRNVNLQSVINLIRTGDDNLIKMSQHIRTRITNGACTEEIRELKARLLPVVSFNGTFEPREKVCNESFIASSGLFCIDIDKLYDQEVLIASKLEICRFPGVVACFISPSGAGLKVLMRVDADKILNNAQFKAAYGQLETFFRLLGYDIDDACKDVRRACYLTIDNDIFYNPDAEVFELKDYVEPLVSVNPVGEVADYVPHNDENRLFNICANILLRAPLEHKHKYRLKAGRLLGGYVSSGQLPPDSYAKLLLVSDKISEGGASTAKERKAVLAGYNQGLGLPLKKPDADPSVGVDDDPEIQDWNPDLSGSIDYIIPFDSVARDIQQFILSRSMYPQPALAYIAALSVVGACIGRSIAYENIKGNMMFIGMCESGEGKDFPFKMAEKILDAVDMGNRIEGKPASGAALFEAIHDKPSMLLRIDEYGHFLNGLNGNGASTFAKEIVTTLTEAYTSANGKLVGKRTKGNDPIVINEPNVCVMGMSTEGQIFNGLKSSDVADGSLARYMMLFGSNDLMPVRIDNFSDAIPASIVDRLNKLIVRFDKAIILTSTQITGSVEFQDAKWDLMCRTKKMSIESKKPMFKPFYNRIAVRAVQGSLLIDQCESVDVLQWFATKEIESIDIFVKKYMHLSADNEHERQFKLLQSKIKEGGKKGISANNLVQSTRQIPSFMRKQMINEMLETGIIIFNLIKCERSRKNSKFYFWVK